MKSGDEVITVPNTFAATVNSIIMTGAKPVFVDINATTFTLDVSKLSKAITAKTKAIIPVHLYGLMADMKPIMEIAEEKGIYVLEDACQAHGAEYYGKRAGELGHIAAFSFFPTKNVTVGGDGGIVLSNDEELIEKIKALRDHGRKNGKHVMAGLNNRLSEILAVIGREHLKKLKSFTEHRRKIAKMYYEYLSDIPEIGLPLEPEGYKHVYHLYTIKAESRDRLQSYLRERGIQTSIMYKELLNKLSYVKKVAGNQETPINDSINPKILSLPISGTLPIENIETVAQEIINFYKKQ